MQTQLDAIFTHIAGSFAFMYFRSEVGLTETFACVETDGKQCFYDKTSTVNRSACSRHAKSYE